MTNDKPKRTRYGGPPPTGLEARKERGNVCTARRTNGEPCSNFAINGSHVCRIHGGAAPQVRARAQVRLLMSADLAAAKLIEMIRSPKVADNIKLAAVRDLLDRANLGATQHVELGVTQRNFDDVLDAILVEVDDDMDVVDAVVVDDEQSSIARDYELEEQDRDRARRKRKNLPPPREQGRKGRYDHPPTRDYADRDAREAEAFEQADRRALDADREALLLAKDRGTYNSSSRATAAREGGGSGRKRAQISDAHMG